MILLLGASGYVGEAFQKFFKENKIPYVCESGIRFPLDEREFEKTLQTHKVTSVFNCGGFTGKPNVDSCELIENKIPAIQANAFLPKQIAKVTSDLGIKLMQVSSGCIFNDPKCEEGKEPTIQFSYKDKPNFTFLNKKHSWYSGTKHLGENLLEGYSGVSICRLRIPFNGEINPRNYLNKLINYEVLVNATNSFSQLDEFVQACYNIDKRSMTGIYNVTQPGWMTTKEVVALLKKYELIEDKQYFKSIEDFERIAKAPRSNCVLKSCSNPNSEVINLAPIELAMEQAIIKYKKNYERTSR